MKIFTSYNKRLLPFLFIVIMSGSIQIYGQNRNNTSDRGTPIIPPPPPQPPCNCTKWQTDKGNTDSTRQKLFEIKFIKNGRKYTRTYYLTTYITEWYDRCIAPANCLGEVKTRKTTRKAITFEDEPDCDLKSFELPCCIDEEKTVSKIARVVVKGAAITDVVYDPPVIAPSRISGNSIQLVKASVCGVSLMASTSLVNPNITQGETPVQFNFSAYKDRFANVLSSFLNGGVSPCEATGSLIPSGNLNYETSFMCCPDGFPCVQTSRKYAGAATWSYGLKCHFPVFGCPYVASLDAVVSAGVSGSVGLNYQTTCTGGKACATLDLKVSAGGGVGFTLAAGLLSGDLQLVIEAGASGELCVFPLPVKVCGKVNVGKVKVVGTVSAVWGIVDRSVDYTVFEGYTTPTFCKTF